MPTLLPRDFKITPSAAAKSAIAGQFSTAGTGKDRTVFPNAITGQPKPTPAVAQPTTPAPTATPSQPTRPLASLSAPVIPTTSTFTPSSEFQARLESQQVRPEPSPTPRLEEPSTIPSSVLGTERTTNDVFSRIEDIFGNLTSTRDQLVRSLQPTEEELALREQINTLNLEEQNLFELEGQGRGIPEVIVSRQQQRGLRDINRRRVVLTNQLNALVQARSSQVEAGKTLMQFDTQNFNLLKGLSELTQPNVLSTQVNKATGEVFTLVQDPRTGNVSTQVVGNIGAEAQAKDYVAQGTYDTPTGKRFYGVTDAGEIEIIDLPGAAGASSSNSTKVASDLRGELNQLPTTKQFFDVSTSFNGINSAFQEALTSKSKGIADQALIRNFVRMTDPGSVVREGEFALSTQGQSLINQIRGKATSVLEGGVGLTDQERQSIVSTSQALYKDYVKRYNQDVSFYRKEAQLNNVDPDRIAKYAPTAGLISPQEAREGDILILDGIPYQKQGNSFLKLEDEPVAVNTPEGGNRPQRNNNPLNIKSSKFTQTFPGVVGTDSKPATDGGEFLRFNTPEAGFQAAKQLLQSDVYASLDMDKALKRWSGGGYGAEIVPQLKGRTINSLTPGELDLLIQTMAHREGYYA